MTVFSRNDIQRYTPARFEGQADAPVYVIRPATTLERMQHSRDVSAAGVRMPSRADLQTALRNGIDAVVLEEDRPALHALVDGDQAGTLTEADAANWAALDAAMIGNWPPYAELVANRDLYLKVFPLFAFRRFVVGWENVEVPYARTGALLSEDVINRLSIEDVLEVGWAAILRGKVSESDEKKSVSPSPSGENPEPLGEISPPEAEGAGSSPV